jgi:xanthine dehydrogenase molybdopterin-binding subunit B
MKKKLRILILIILVLNLIHEKSSFANNVNQTIESFSKAKKILKKFILKNLLHFTVSANIKKINLIGNLVAFYLRKIKKEHLELNGSMFYQLRILVLNLILRKKGTTIL